MSRFLVSATEYALLPKPRKSRRKFLTFLLLLLTSKGSFLNSSFVPYFITYVSDFSGDFEVGRETWLLRFLFKYSSTLQFTQRLGFSIPHKHDLQESVYRYDEDHDTDTYGNYKPSPSVKFLKNYFNNTQKSHYISSGGLRTLKIDTPYTSYHRLFSKQFSRHLRVLDIKVHPIIYGVLTEELSKFISLEVFRADFTCGNVFQSQLLSCLSKLPHLHTIETKAEAYLVVEHHLHYYIKKGKQDEKVKAPTTALEDFENLGKMKKLRTLKLNGILEFSSQTSVPDPDNTLRHALIAAISNLSSSLVTLHLKLKYFLPSSSQSSSTTSNDDANEALLCDAILNLHYLEELWIDDRSGYQFDFDKTVRRFALELPNIKRLHVSRVVVSEEGRETLLSTQKWITERGIVCGPQLAKALEMINEEQCKINLLDNEDGFDPESDDYYASEGDDDEEEEDGDFEEEEEEEEEEN